jgi:hypothetical protein
MDKRTSLNTEYNSLVGTHPDAAASIQKPLKVLCSIADLASCTPASVGEGEEWAAIVSSATARLYAVGHNSARCMELI